MSQANSPRRRPNATGQQPLFDEPVQAAGSSAMLAISTPAAAQSKAQRAFNRLIAQLQQQRLLLAQWQDFGLRYHQRLVHEMAPVQAQLRSARRALMLLLDQLMAADATPKLAKTQRRKLAAWVPHLASLLLEEGPDAEAEALFDRYSDVRHADLLQADLAGAEAVLSRVLGEDAFKDHQAGTMDDLLRHAAQHIAAQAQTEQQDGGARAQSSAKGRRAEAERLRQEAATQQAGQSVREVFRKLASALHPDRETDAVERERKTRLMQQANQAYQRNDLLGLLTMQLDLEQIDGQHLINLSEARLAHYNQVLREQLDLLLQEVQTCVEPYRMAMGPGHRQLTPAAVEIDLTQEITDLRQCAEAIERDTALLRDPALRRTVINALDLPDAGDDEPDAFEMMLMMEALADAPPPGRRKKRR
jgi:hypothetical protein